MKTKICSNCKVEKDVCEFGKKITTSDGLQSRCKICRKIESKKDYENNIDRHKCYREKNKEKRKEDFKKWYSENPNYSKEGREKNKEKRNKWKREYYKKNKEKLNNQGKPYREKNKEKINEKGRLYREKNKEILNEKKREKRKENLELFRLKERTRFEENPHLKLIRNYRTRIKNYMRFNKISLGTGSLDLVGLSSEDLKIYLESKFLEGMSWDNYGLYGWHMDHIIPLSSAKNEEELKKLCHYTNLQPLWAFDNLSKCNKIIVD